MTKRMLTPLALALLVGGVAHAAAEKQPVADAAPQEIDVDAMARAKDGKPTEPLKSADTAGKDAAPTAPAAPEPAAQAASAAAPASVAAESAPPQAASAPADAGSTAPANDAATNAAPRAEAAPASTMERPSPLAPPPAPTSVDKSIAAACEARATNLLDAAQKGDFSAATHDFDAKMRTALPPEKFGQVWRSLAQFGALQARGQAHPIKGDGYIAITIPLIFDKANLYAQVACGSDGRVAGFYVKPL